MLAISTAIFHTVKSRTSFLPAFHVAINFNIFFAAIILAAAFWIRVKLRKIAIK